MYSHGQDLFTKLFSKIAINLGEQLLSMTVCQANVIFQNEGSNATSETKVMI